MAEPTKRRTWTQSQVALIVESFATSKSLYGPAGALAQAQEAASEFADPGDVEAKLIELGLLPKPEKKPLRALSDKDRENAAKVVAHVSNLAREDAARADAIARETIAGLRQFVIVRARAAKDVNEPHPIEHPDHSGVGGGPVGGPHHEGA